MTSSLQKWPNNWDNHIIRSCELYFENKEINFIEYNSYESSMPDNNGNLKKNIYSIKIEFEYNGLYFFVNMWHYNKFSIAFWHKDYNLTKNMKNLSPSLFISIMGHCAGYDQLGAYMMIPITMPIEKQFPFNEKPYIIIKAIEDAILNYKDKRDNDWDNENEEDVPIEPISPTEVVEPELMLI